MAEFPKSFNDPAYDAADVSSAATAGIDPILLQSVRTNGERSNADQVSSAGARTPYQFTPATKKLIEDKYGIDVSLNPQNASLGAAYLLKEGMARNKGNAAAAVAEYHGGTDPANHGPITKAYTQRVMGGAQDAYLNQLAQEVKAGKPDPDVPKVAESKTAPTQTEDPLDALAMQIKNEPTIGQQAVGAGETALALGTGATGGTVGMIGGTVKGTAEQLLSGQFGTPQAADAIENSAMQGASALTYAPRTKAGQDMTQSAAEALAPLAAFAPMTGELSAIGQGSKAALPAIGAKVEGALAPVAKVFQKSDVPTEAPPVAASIAKAADTVPVQTAEIPVAAEVPTASSGQPSISMWRFGDKEYPVDVLPGQDIQSAGQTYQRIRFQGKEQFVPEDQLTAVSAPTEKPVSAPNPIPAAEPAPPVVTAPEQPAGPQMAPADLGDLVKKASGGRGAPKAQEQLAEMAKINPEAKAAADRLGIDLPADVFSDNPQIRAAAGLTRSGVASEAEAAWKTTVKGAVDKADDVIKQFDTNFVEGSPSTGAISQKVLDSLNKTRSDLNMQASKLYDEVDAAMPKQTPVTFPNLKSTLTSITDEVGVGGMTSSERKLLSLVDDPQATYGRLIREKNLIGQAIAGKDSPYGNMDAAALKRLYSGLAEDQLHNVEAIAGEPVRQQLRAANLIYAKERALGKRIVGAFGKEADGSISNLMRSAISSSSKGDAAQFNKLFKVVPDDLKKETVATALASISRSNRSAEPGFGFSEFAKVYPGLRANAPVYSNIIKALGEGSDKVLRDLYEVSKRITEARANVLATGKANQAILKSLKAEGLIQGIAQSAMGRRAIAAGASIIGGPAGAAMAPDIISSLAKGNKDSVALAGKLFASPEFQKLAVDAATKERIAPAVVKRVVLSPAFKKFAKSINLPNAPTEREAWLLGLVQESSQSNQDNRHVVH